MIVTTREAIVCRAKIPLPSEYDFLWESNSGDIQLREAEDIVRQAQYTNLSFAC